MYNKPSDRVGLIKMNYDQQYFSFCSAAKSNTLKPMMYSCCAFNFTELEKLENEALKLLSRKLAIDQKTSASLIKIK